MKWLISIVSVLALLGCDGVFESIEIADGTKDATASQTVNGGIRVGDDVTVTSGTFRAVNGSARVGDRSLVPAISLVNGGIRIGDDSTTGTLETVNGGITVGARSAVEGSVGSVNGAISLAEGSSVDGNVRSVNGQLRLASAHVSGDLRNVNGGMQIDGTSVVDGDVIVSRPEGMNFGVDEIPTVTIGPEARVSGTMRFERSVNLIIHRGAEVGPIEGAEPQWVEPEAPESEDEAQDESGEV